MSFHCLKSFNGPITHKAFKASKALGICDISSSPTASLNEIFTVIYTSPAVSQYSVFHALYTNILFLIDLETTYVSSQTLILSPLRTFPQPPAELIAIFPTSAVY